MRDLTDKITVYKKIFDNRVPAWQRAYLRKRLEEQELKQEKERQQFKKEMALINKKSH